MTKTKNPYAIREVELSGYDLTVMENLDRAGTGSYPARNWCRDELIKSVSSEALSSSDFAAAYQNIQNYVIQNKFGEADPIWPQLATKRFVDDPSRPEAMLSLQANTANLLASNGGVVRVPGTLPRVPELSEFPTINYQASEWNLDTAKNGARISFSWEAFFGDRWNQIMSLPDELVKLHLGGHETSVLNQFFTQSGFNTNYFVSGTNLANNPVLNFANLQAAVTKASTPPPPEAGIERPLVNPIARWKLVVPQALELQARALLSITQYEVEIGTGVKSIASGNPFGNIDLVVVPWIPSFYWNAAAWKSTGWCLVPANGEGQWGPSISLVFLRGNEAPELRIKKDAGRYLNGGDVNPFDGSFDNDSIQIRIRSLYKGNTHSPFGAVYSKGDASATVA